MAKGAKKEKDAGKKEKKVKKTSKKWENYQVSGETLNRKNRFCPKCGDGVFMAKHKDRQTCGKCGYMEKTSKS